MPLCRLIHSASFFWSLILILLQAHLEDDSISYLESTVHYSHILPAKEKGDDEDEERAEQPEDATMGDDFSPPGYLQVRLEGIAR